MVLVLTSHKRSLQQRRPFHCVEIILKIMTSVVWFIFCHCITLRIFLLFLIARILFLIFWSEYIVCCLKILILGKQEQVFTFWQKKKKGKPCHLLVWWRKYWGSLKFWEDSWLWNNSQLQVIMTKYKWNSLYLKEA